MVRKRLPGEQARLYIDAAQPIEPGDYIRTQSGRTYLVDTVRLQQRGKWVGRQHLLTTVMEPDFQPEPDAFVLEIRWYSRSRRSSR